MGNGILTTKDILQYQSDILEFRKTYWTKIAQSLSKIIAEDCSEARLNNALSSKDASVDVQEISTIKGILSCVMNMINLKVNRLNKRLDAVQILIQQEQEEE